MQRALIRTSEQRVLGTLQSTFFWNEIICIPCAYVCVRSFDVVVLQEVWGSQVAKLEAPLLSSYQIAAEARSWGSSIIDTMLYYARGRGGLWFAIRNVIRLTIPIFNSEISEALLSRNFLLY